jgi:hypothetical protein
MACSDENRGRSRRSDAEDWGWSHRSGTWWPGSREVGWSRVRSASDTWRLGDRVLGGWAVERSDGAVCGLHLAHGDYEREFLG